jgi:RNA polymerase II subunit A-like phosphatase
MKISSPPGLRYPYTIQALQKRKDEHVNRSDKLFTYWYEETVTENDKWGGEHTVQQRRHQQFDASTEGNITRWFTKPGAVIVLTQSGPYSSRLKSHAHTRRSLAAFASTAART